MRRGDICTVAGGRDYADLPHPIVIVQDDSDATDPTTTCAFTEALCCPKRLVRFTAEEGADDWRSLQNRSLFNQRVPDRLDEQFEVSPQPFCGSMHPDSCGTRVIPAALRASRRGSTRYGLESR